VPTLAELIDTVVGVDTHRDTHEVEIALPAGTPIGRRKISNDTAGYAELLAWIVDHAAGPRVVASIEGTRSFGVGLARAVAAAGLVVVECEQPNRKARRGKGKSDPSTPISRCSPRCVWTPVDRAPRRRRGHRGPGHRVVLSCWPVPKRRRVRRAVGDRPAAGQQRQDGAAPAQPRRRPRVELRDPHHRHDPHGVLRHIARKLDRALDTSTALAAPTLTAPAAA
jgi:hypothetical protein